MPVSIGPLGNKQVRVEDSVTVQSASPAGAGTAAVQNILCVSAGDIPAGAYWMFTEPFARSDTPSEPTRKYHVWYQIDGTGIDPLPGSTNQVGMKVIGTTGDASATVAAATASVIEAYFAGPNVTTASATATAASVILTIGDPGPARIHDGFGSRGGVTVSSGFTFVSTVPGVAADIRTFEVASTIEASAATGASVFSLVARHTGSVFEVAADNEITRIVCPDMDTNITSVTGASASFFQLRGQDEAFYVWFLASDATAGAVTVDPTSDASGTAVAAGPLASGDLAAVVATAVAVAVNALAAFSASATGSVVTVIGASNGAVTLFSGGAAASDGVITSSVIVTQNQLGGGDWSIDFSNKFPNPAVDLESSRD